MLKKILAKLFKSNTLNNIKDNQKKLVENIIPNDFSETVNDILKVQDINDLSVSYQNFIIDNLYSIDSARKFYKGDELFKSYEYRLTKIMANNISRVIFNIKQNENYFDNFEKLNVYLKETFFKHLSLTNKISKKELIYFILTNNYKNNYSTLLSRSKMYNFNTYIGYMGNMQLFNDTELSVIADMIDDYLNEFKYNPEEKFSELSSSVSSLLSTLFYTNFFTNKALVERYINNSIINDYLYTYFDYEIEEYNLDKKAIFIRNIVHSVMKMYYLKDINYNEMKNYFLYFKENDFFDLFKGRRLVEFYSNILVKIESNRYLIFSKRNHLEYYNTVFDILNCIKEIDNNSYLRYIGLKDYHEISKIVFYNRKVRQLIIKDMFEIKFEEESVMNNIVNSIFETLKSPESIENFKQDLMYNKEHENLFDILCEKYYKRSFYNERIASDKIKIYKENNLLTKSYLYQEKIKKEHIFRMNFVLSKLKSTEDKMWYLPKMVDRYELKHHRFVDKELIDLSEDIKIEAVNNLIKYIPEILVNLKNNHLLEISSLLRNSLSFKEAFLNKIVKEVHMPSEVIDNLVSLSEIEEIHVIQEKMCMENLLNNQDSSQTKEITKKRL